MQRIFLITVLFLFPFNVLADFSCKTDVTYTWKKAKIEKKVVFKHVYANYNSEAQGKLELKREGERAKLEASKECSRTHENLANCIVSKLKNLAGTTASLGFKSRSMLESAVEQDCKLQTGVCVAANMTDIVCEMNISGAPSPEVSVEEVKGKAKK